VYPLKTHTKFNQYMILFTVWHVCTRAVMSNIRSFFATLKKCKVK